MRQATSLKEGGKGAKRHFKLTDKLEFNKFAVAGKKFFEIAAFCVIVNMYCYVHKSLVESKE